jgi:hypothetical protein
MGFENPLVYCFPLLALLHGSRSPFLGVYLIVVNKLANICAYYQVEALDLDLDLSIVLHSSKLVQ